MTEDVVFGIIIGATFAGIISLVLYHLAENSPVEEDDEDR